METVLLQLFGFTEEVKVYVFLKTSMAPDHVVLAQELVTLNAQNHHQAAAKLRVRHTQSGTAVIYYIYKVYIILIVMSLSFLFLSLAAPRSAG